LKFELYFNQRAAPLSSSITLWHGWFLWMIFSCFLRDMFYDITGPLLCFNVGFIYHVNFTVFLLYQPTQSE